MKCFIAVDEATLLRLWLKDPALIQPLTRPFYPTRRQEEAANQSVLLGAAAMEQHAETMSVAMQDQSKAPPRLPTLPPSRA